MEIRPDQSVGLNVQFNGEVHEFLLDPVYDRMDRFAWLGFNLLKIVDPEKGFAQIPFTDEEAATVQIPANLPLVERDFITEREYDIYIRWQEQLLDDNWLAD